MPTYRPPEAEPAPKTAFLITVDTEGDNLWSPSRTITTRNSEFLERFQTLCEDYHLKPTYVADWEMAECPVFRQFARDVLDGGQAEIGMHLHAWNTPPLEPLTDDDVRYNPYLIEYPQAQIREKVTRLTALLEDTFGLKMVSHRAGRWAFDEFYASVLADLGYLVDCSVTPHITWAPHSGAPGGRGGSDYRGFPDEAYWLDLDNLSRKGNSPLLEVPLTVIPRGRFAVIQAARRLLQPFGPGRRAMKRYFPAEWRFRPTGRNQQQLLAILSIAQAQRRDHVELMLHSSELMPGGSPTFPSPESVEALYRDLKVVFAAAAEAEFEGMTLHEYYQHFRRQQRVG